MCTKMRKKQREKPFMETTLHVLHKTHAVLKYRSIVSKKMTVKRVKYQIIDKETLKE